MYCFKPIIRNYRCYYYYCVTIVIISILGNLAKFVDGVSGCITMVINGEGKRMICNKLETRFTRIPEKSPEFVVMLEMVNQNIHSLTADQFTKLPLLTDLTVEHSKLSSIDSDAFIHVPKLQKLFLRNNFLILGGNSFPSAALLNLRFLRVLNLERNPLGFVPDFYFQPLKLLQKLILSRAPGGFYIEPNGFAGLTSLETLDLSMSHITSLDSQIEPSLKNMQLQQFYLFGNNWHCDCHLKWLQKWHLKYRDVKVYRTFQKTNGLEGLAQPNCATPSKHKNRNIFRVSSHYEYLKTDELVCVPKPMTKNQQLQIDQGRNLTLTCEFEADPGGSVEWSKNGMIVQKHWKRIRWGQTSGIRFSAWLAITRAEIEDNGLWRCILITDVGKGNVTFTLRVRHTTPPPIDLSIILKYIGIGAVTLILLLVIIGIAIYCVYGFKIRPFIKQRKIPDSTRNSRHSHAPMGNAADYGNQGPPSTGIRPILITAAIDKVQHEDDLIHFPSTDDSQKCLLLPNSPTMVIPVNNNIPCPLHGNLGLLGNSCFHDIKPSSVDHSASAVQAHTLPRHGHQKIITKVATAPTVNPTGIPNNSVTPCPLHGHILASLQRSANDDDGMDAIYSTFFSPRHSQPLLGANITTFPSDSAATNGPIGEQCISHRLFGQLGTAGSRLNGPFPPTQSSSHHPKSHDDEGYSTSV